MKTRDDYVAKLKTQLDRWNADVAKWEAQADTAKADMKKQYAKQLEILRAQREVARYNLRLVEGASATAWTDLSKGADEAWARMREAIAAARSHFEKS
ncbi:MAG: sll1863 family stress response protein [Usitatibacter sp.]